MLMQSKIYAQCEQLGYRARRQEENIIFFSLDSAQIEQKKIGTSAYAPIAIT